MSLKLTAESFLAGIKQCGLFEPDMIDTLVETLREEGVDIGSSAALADAMMSKSVITPWQSENLLQGKFKGFILGRYKLQNLLGQDEMSSVYLAEHTRMKRLCAIKVLPANKVCDTSFLRRFDREAQAVASLDHPNIVRVYDVDTETEDGVEIHYLVMEYIAGQDIEKRLESKQQFAVVEAVDYIRQAAEGLSHAHENGLVHGDIKPGNLLVDAKGVVKLLDLGLARFFRDTVSESLTIKHDEKVLGPADDLAPEQAVDGHAVDERADIYSLGCTLYFALTGHPPFTDGTLVQRLLAHQTKAPPSVSRERADVPESLTAIIHKMMQKRKEDRYQLAADAAAALSKWLVENGDSKWRQSHPALVARFASLDDVLRCPDAAQNVDRQSTESKPSANAVSMIPPISEVDVLAEVVQPALVTDSSPVVATVSHPMWIAAPPSAPLAAPPLPAVVRTSPNNRIDQRVIYLASLVIGAVLLVAGVGYRLVASSDEGTSPVIQPGLPPRPTQSTIGP